MLQVAGYIEVIPFFLGEAKSQAAIIRNFDNQQTIGAQDSLNLGQLVARLREMLEDMPEGHDIEEPVGKCRTQQIALLNSNAFLAGEITRGWRKFCPIDFPAARFERGEKVSITATYIQDSTRLALGKCTAMLPQDAILEESPESIRAEQARTIADIVVLGIQRGEFSFVREGSGIAKAALRANDHREFGIVRT